MRSRFYRIIAFISAVALIGYTFSACIKSDESNTKATGSGAIPVTALKTTVSSTVNTTVKNTANITSAAKASTTTSALNTEDAGKDIESENYESSQDLTDNSDNVPDADSGALLEERKIDFGGRTLVITHRSNYTTGDAFKIWKESEIAACEKYNCKIEWNIPVTGASAFLNYVKQRALSGTETSDAILIDDYHLWPWGASNNYFLTMEEVFQGTEDWEFISSLLQPYSQWIDGKHYGFLDYATAHPCNVIWYNDKMLSREGIPDIKSYYVHNNQWTWDNFLAVASAATKDTNGDGIIDQWGIASSADNLGLFLIESNGGSYVTGDFTTGVKFNLVELRSIKALQFMSDLFNVHKVITESVNMTSGAPANLTAAMFFTFTWGFLSVPTLEENYLITYVPRGPDMDNYTTGSLDQCRFIAFAANINPAADIIRVFAEVAKGVDDRLKDPEEGAQANIGRALTWKIYRDENVQFIATHNYRPIYSFARVYGNLRTIIANDIYNKIKKMEVPVTTALEAAKAPAQAEIDKVLGQ